MGAPLTPMRAHGGGRSDRQPLGFASPKPWMAIEEAGTPCCVKYD